MTNESQGTVWAVVAAAGTGQRFSNGKQDKLLAMLDSLPILVRTVETILNAPSIAGAIVVTHEDKRTLYQRMLVEYKHRKPAKCIVGGQSRRESVYLGLKALPEDCTRVLIHDAARPLVTPALVEEGLTQLGETLPGVITALPIYDTIKQSPDGKHIKGTVNRQVLWRAQTPQFFQTALILKAHEHVPTDVEATDDAQLMEMAGIGPLELLHGSEHNLKITTPDDLKMAEQLIRQKH